MSDQFTLQSLVDKRLLAQQRAEINQQQRAAARQQKLASTTIEQLQTALARHPYLEQLFTLTDDPTIEQLDDTTALATQLLTAESLTNVIKNESIAMQIEKYTDDRCLYLRLFHEPSASHTCLKINDSLSADCALEQIASATAKLVSAVQTWCAKDQQNQQLAQQILIHTRDWYQQMMIWDDACLHLAQEMLEQHWTPHMLYRLRFVPATSPVEPDTHSASDAPPTHVETIITCTEPNPGRISYTNIAKTGAHSIQIILGGLLAYEPIIFESAPQINQPLPYHVSRRIGHHTIFLPPCDINSYALPTVPPQPPTWRDYLLAHHLDLFLVDNLILHYEYDDDTTIPEILTCSPSELVGLNPGSIFS